MRQQILSVIAVICIISIIFVVAYQDDPRLEGVTASRNISKAIDNFELDRRIVFYDSDNGEYALVIEGRCSIERGSELEVICKIAPDDFKTYFINLSNDMTYFAEQLENVDTNTYHHRVIFNQQKIPGGDRLLR